MATYNKNISHAAYFSSHNGGSLRKYLLLFAVIYMALIGVPLSKTSSPRNEGANSESLATVNHELHTEWIQSGRTYPPTAAPAAAPVPVAVF